jgi:hypothetical protein
MKTLLLSLLAVGCCMAQTEYQSPTITGNFNASGATTTKPHKAGLSAAIPATCSVGETYFKTDATAGQNIFGCTATNTWTIQGPTRFSGTAVMGTSSIASGACATAVTVSATGVATTDVITAGFNGDPVAVTGYMPSTAGMLTIIPYPSTNNVNFKVCNNTASPIIPGAITLNWRVSR